MKKLIILFGALFLCLLTLQATENNNGLNNYEIRTKDKIISFVEIETDKVIKTINTDNDNPYIQQGFERITNSKSGEVYIPKDFLSTYPLNKGSKYYLTEIKDDKILGRSNPEIFFSSDNKYIGINYGFGFMGPDAEYEPSFSTAYFKIYNAKGQLINEVEVRDRGCGFPVLSNQAEYLGYKFRQPYGLAGRVKKGFAVYDFKQKKLVVEDFIPKGYQSAYPVIEHNQMTYLFHNSDFFIYVVQDFSYKKSYKKSYSQKKYFKLKKKTKEGLFFKSENNRSLELVSFEKDFDIIEW
jgi:hypothetical protein